VALALVLLDIDLGELPDEPEELYGLADVANIACGGHAGSPMSMARAVKLCARHGTWVGAHPSYPDRANFGRKRMTMEPGALRTAITTQCAALAALARVRFVKAHGALYHDAREDETIARALVDGVVAALGHDLHVIGGGTGLEAACTRAGVGFLREGFADRGVGPDGLLLPRDQPGALITDPQAARTRAAQLIGQVDILCVHGDTPGAVRIASAVRELLGAKETE
jgi:UPF0271 protein